MDPAYRLAYRLAFTLLRGWWFLRRPRTFGAAVALWDGERLLVVRCSYRPGLDLPGGGVDRGEDLAMAAVRELREEVGIAAPTSALGPPIRLQFVANHRRITDTVFAWRPAVAPEPRIDRREIVWAGYLPRAELAKAELSQGLARYLAAEAA